MTRDMKRSVRLVLPFSLCFLLLVLNVEGQEMPDEKNKLQLAQSFERTGQFEKAAELYRELHARDPWNYVFFDGLHRMYLQLKEYDKAIELVRARLQRQPKDLVLLGILGEDYFRAGKETEANSAWEEALATDAKNQNVYHHIAHILLQNRLFAKSVEVYLRGRRSVGNPTLFAADLGYAYTLLGKYQEATREYASALKGNPGLLNFVQSRMALYTGKTEGLTLGIRGVQEEIQRDKNNLTLHRLLAWLYLEGKQFENALNVYRVIDELSSSSGQELLGFGDKAFKEKAFEVSARAFKEIISRHPKTQHLPVAKLGYARAIEELSRTNDTLLTGKKAPVRQLEGEHIVSETHPSFGGAIAYYREIVRSYPQSDYALQSLYRIGLIKFERYFDLDGALQALEEIEKGFPPNRVIPSVGMKAGEILLAKGELKRATEQFINVTQNPLAGQDDKDRAKFALAELDYFQGSFDSALAKLTNLLDNLSADIANDGLLLQQFIKEHHSGKELALREYAHAELLERQRKFSEAIAVLDRLLNTSATAPIADDALMKVGSVRRKMGNPVEALSAYERVIREYPASIARDKAQFIIGEIYQYDVRDQQKAILAYQRLLENYPNSLLLEEARKRIRNLRGDAL